MSLGDTARAIDVDDKTLYNWRRDAAFVEALDARRAELWDDAAQRLRAMVHPSLDILEQDLANRHERARFRAATAVLRLADLRRTLHPAREKNLATDRHRCAPIEAKRRMSHR